VFHRLVVLFRWRWFELFLLITAPAIAVTLAPLLNDQDFLVWAGVAVGAYFYVHAEYHDKIKHAVTKRVRDFQEKGAQSRIKSEWEGRLPKKWLDFARYLYLASLLMTFLQIADDVTVRLTSSYFGFFDIGVVFFLMGLIETNRIMNVADTFDYTAKYDIGQTANDLFVIVAAMLNIRLLLSLLPRFTELDIFSVPYILASVASLMASPFVFADFNPFPNRTWVKAAFVLLLPFVYIGLFTLIYTGVLP